jgi:hypothetical protein
MDIQERSSFIRFKRNTNIEYPLAFGMIRSIIVVKFITWLFPTLVSTVDKPCEGVIPCLLETIGLNLEMAHTM